MSDFYRPRATTPGAPAFEADRRAANEHGAILRLNLETLRARAALELQCTKREGDLLRTAFAQEVARVIDVTLNEYEQMTGGNHDSRTDRPSTPTPTR